MAFAGTALGVGSILSGASSLWSAGSSGNMNRKNRKWQEKMYKQSLSDQRENAKLQWQENRDYAKWSYQNFESPAAQRAAMAAAGINPFVEGSVLQPMGATQGSASSPEGGSLPSQGPYQSNPGSAIQPGMSAMMSGISQMQAIKASNANIELMNAQKIKTLAEAKGVENTNSMFEFIRSAAESDALSKKFKAKVSEVEAAFAEANAISDVNEKQAKIASLWAQYEKDLAQAAKTDADRLTVDTLRDLQKKSLEAGIGLTEAQTKTEGAKQSNLASLTETENALREGKIKIQQTEAQQVIQAAFGSKLANLEVAERLARVLTGTDRSSSLYSILDKALESLGTRDHEEKENVRRRFLEELRNFVSLHE